MSEFKLPVKRDSNWAKVKVTFEWCNSDRRPVSLEVDVERNSISPEHRVMEFFREALRSENKEGN
jgi:hypothetical protein